MQRNTQKKLLVACMVGASGVGKTSLMSAYISNRFGAQNGAPYTSTIGCDFLTTELKYKEDPVTYKIWDTVEQDKAFVQDTDPESLSFRNFGGKPDIYFACIDLNNPLSLIYIDQALAKIKEHSPDADVVLVRTKSDLPESTVINPEEVSVLMKKYNIGCYTPVSAKNYEDGLVAALFKSAFNLAMARKTKLANTSNIQTNEGVVKPTVFKLFDQERDQRLTEHTELLSIKSLK